VLDDVIITFVAGVWDWNLSVYSKVVKISPTLHSFLDP